MKMNNALYYNLAIQFTPNIEDLIDIVENFVKIGYNRFAIIYGNPKDLSKHDQLKHSLQTNINGDFKVFSRFHISLNSFKDKTEVNRGDIFRLRRKAVEKVCIVSIDDIFFKKILNPNDSLKFNLITINSPTFKMLIKLIKKPVLFEYQISRKTVNPKWLSKRLYLLKLLLDNEKLIVSTAHSLYSPAQVANFIYGLMGYNNFSYNVVSTLPIKLVEKCVLYKEGGG